MLKLKAFLFKFKTYKKPISKNICIDCDHPISKCLREFKYSIGNFIINLYGFPWLLQLLKFQEK